MTAFSPIASLMAALDAQLAASPAPAMPAASAGFLELLTEVEVAAEEDVDAPAAPGREERVEESDTAVAAWAAVLPVVIPVPVERAAPTLSLDVAVEEGDEAGEAVLAPASPGRTLPAEISFQATEARPVSTTNAGGQPQDPAVWTTSSDSPVAAPSVVAPARVVGEVETPAGKAQDVSRAPDAPAPYESAGPNREDLHTLVEPASARVSVRRAPVEMEAPSAPERSVMDLGIAPPHPDTEAPRRAAETAPELPLTAEPPAEEARRVEFRRTLREETQAAPQRPGEVERVKAAVDGERHLDAELRGDDADVLQRQQPPVSVSPVDAAPVASVPHSALRELVREAPVERRAAAPPLPSRTAPPRKVSAAAVRPAELRHEPVLARPHLAFGARLTPMQERVEPVEPKAPEQRPETGAAAEPLPSWTAAPNKGAVAAERPETPSPSEAPRTQDVKAVTPRRPAPLPAPVARDIRLEVGEPDRKVEVRLVERAGEVRVAVRTPDDRLAEGLREQLPSLSSRLEQTGFRADEWKAASAGQAERRLDVDAPAAMADNSRQQGQPQERGHERRESEPRPHGDPQQESRRQKEKGNAFAWLMESLR